MENDAIKFVDGIHKRFDDAQKVSRLMAIAAVVISLGAIIASYSYVNKQKEQIYVLDQGAVLSAFRSDNGVQKDLEVMNHMYRFHELMFNMPPNMELIRRNVEAALELADRSAYDYFADLNEGQYYTRLITTNSTQQIAVDSVKTDVEHYPYRTVTYATVYVIRESNITQFSFRSECVLTETPRTPKNPHGLLIEKFWVPEFQQGETRGRR